MQRTISIPALLLASVSAIIGSGWLFTAYYTAELAGPAALLAWVIGGCAFILVAFVFAELSAMIPIVGSSTRIPLYTHGTLVSFLFSWIIWLSYAAMVPTEVQAIVQYASYYFPLLVHFDGSLTHQGYAVATLLMLLVSALNVFSLRWLMRCNSVLTILKILIPLFICSVLLILFFSPQREFHPAYSQFMPFGWHGVFAALTTGGIAFAFNGFKQACELAGEAKNPTRALPIAIIGSVGLCLLIYLLIQSALFTSLTGKNLISGWANLHLAGANSPLAAILAQDNLQWLMPILYLGALIGPLAAALMYMSSASRSLYGKSKNGYIPEIFQLLNSWNNPTYAIVANFLLGMCVFAPLPGWNSMIGFMTSLMGATYAIGPVSMLALYRQVPEFSRPFKLPLPHFWGYITFYFCTLLTYWSGWNIIWKLILAIIFGVFLFFLYYFLSERGRKLELNWRQSIWVWPYFMGIAIISYFGNYGGGRGVISFGWDFIIIALFCMIIIYLPQKFILPAHKTKQYLAKLNIKGLIDRV